MSARIKIDQVGLPAGVAGRARTDGLDSGAIVTLEDVSGTGNSTFHLLWGPPDDPVAEASLAPTGDPDVWTFEPNTGSEGSYLIELRDNGDPVERRVFGIRTAANHLLIPAFNERASRHAGWTNDGADQTELSDNNAIDYAEASLNDHPYAGWWRSLAELYRVVEAGTGGIADHSLPLVKLELAPSKAVVVNPGAVADDAQYLVGAAAFEYLRVNAANNGLEWATLAAQASASIIYDAPSNTFVRAGVTGVVVAPQNTNVSSFAAAAGKSVLINAANGSAVPAFVAGTAALQMLRVNAANNGLEWATLSIANDFVTNTMLANMAANTIKANPTAGSADPQDMALAVQSLLLRAAGVIINAAAGADGVLQRLASGDLGFSTRRTGLAGANSSVTISAATTVVEPSGSYTIPAGAAVGDRYTFEFACLFNRGATATALNLEGFFDTSAGVVTFAYPTPTVAGSYSMTVRGSLTVLSTGVGGSCVLELTAFGSAFSSVPPSATVANTFTYNTTATCLIRAQTRMSAVVANTQLITLGGHIARAM